MRVSVVATGIDPALIPAANPSAVERITDPIARQRIQRTVETRRELPRPSMECHARARLSRAGPARRRRL